MNAEHWERIWTIFEAVVGQPQDDRKAYLDTACGDDPEVRSAVEEMLEADAGEAFLDQPVLAQARAASSEGRTVTHGPSNAWHDTAPERIGNYRILRRVGQGGMGVVYLAVRDDEAFDRRVVIKLVRQGMSDPASLARLRVERQILASLDHPHIARLYDGGSTEDGTPYFVMEYVEGVPIDVFCQQNDLSIDDRIALFLRVCDAVRYAHQNLVVHRDLKPANILVTAGGDPKLLDFGIAKLMNPDLASPQVEPTITWQRAMTPSYASPEQIRGQLVTTSSDVYSLGVLLYKLLTGRVPYRFAGRSPAEIERLVVDHPPTPPSRTFVAEAEDRTTTLTGDRRVVDLTATPSAAGNRRRRRQVAGDLDAIVLKALRAAPQQRYGSVEQLTDDLHRRQDGRPVLARQGSWRYRLGKLLRRHRAGVAMAGLAALLLMAFGIAMALQSARVRAERDQAVLERDRNRQLVSLFDAIVAYAEPYEAQGEDLTVREAVVRTVPVVAPRLSTEPDLRASVLQATGTILSRLGMGDDARRHLEEALELRRSLYGEADPLVIETKSDLASVLKVSGEYEAAETLARDAVARARTTFGDDDPGLVAPLNALVSVLCYQGRLDEADGLAQEALVLAPRLGPQGIDEQIWTLELMATIRQGQQRYAEAETFYRDALEQRRTAYGNDHPAQQASLHNLAFVLHRQGRLVEAERSYRRTLDLIRVTFGEDHTEYAQTLNNLAGVRFAKGDYAASINDFETTLGILRSHMDADSLRLFFVEQWVEAVRIHLGEPAAAEANLRRALDRWGPIAGEHWIMARAESILGEAIAAQGRAAEAAPLLESSFRVLAADASPREAGKGIDRLAPVLESLGRSEELESLRALIASG